MNNFSFLFLLLACCLAGCIEGEYSKYETGKDFPVYGGNLSGDRYSPLNEINLKNIKSLKITWMYDSRDSIDIKATGE